MINWTVRESTTTVAEMPTALRPADALRRQGVDNLDEAALVACMLTGNRKHNAMDLARGLLASVPLAKVRHMTVDALATCPGMTGKQAAVLLAGIELGRRVAMTGVTHEESVRTPEDIARLLTPRINGATQEKFYVIPLDGKNRMACEPVEITCGLLDASLVHPREVFRTAIMRNSVALVVAHNHPSGDPTPSVEDIRITRQLVSAGQAVHIKVLDHVVLGSPINGAPAFVSLREHGLVDFDGGYDENT